MNPLRSHSVDSQHIQSPVQGFKDDTLTPVSERETSLVMDFLKIFPLCICAGLLCRT